MRTIFASLAALSLLGCLATTWGEPELGFGSEQWRRTANGWERRQKWVPRILPASPQLHPAVVGVLEVLLVLTIATLSQQNDAWKVMRTAPTIVQDRPRRRHSDRNLTYDPGGAVPQQQPSQRTSRTTWSGNDRRRAASPIFPHLTSDL